MALQVELSIQSRVENLELVQMVLEETMVHLDVEGRVSYEVGMAVREAVANAIEHGNRSAPEKKVQVALDLLPGELVIKVRDEGDGFDPDGVSDPRAPVNLLRPGGRGILFMKEFMDEIDYTFGLNGGTEVTLRKQVRGAAGSTDEEEV
ncbi:MAG: ATP-binding protein [bacterium]|nr:ATP-binding protein [bacterium]